MTTQPFDPAPTPLPLASRAPHVNADAALCCDDDCCDAGCCEGACCGQAIGLAPVSEDGQGSAWACC